MKIKQIAQILYDWNPIDRKSNDGIVFGDENAEVKKAAVCCIATCDVIKKARAMGADLIITHEPTFHKYSDCTENDIVAKAKRQLVEDAGIPILRIHDYAHYSKTDRIIEGVLKKLGWHGSFGGGRKFTFDESKTIAEIKLNIEEKLGLGNIRICGALDNTVKSISMCLGAAGDETVLSELAKNEIDAVVCGEITEWKSCEYARDAAQLGLKKSLFLLGHMGSEKAGMEHICEYLCDNIADVEFVYIDCGEVYS